MKYKKQVESNHYDFGRYMSIQRWCSFWHQLDELQKLKPESVLEIGSGSGLLKIVAAKFGIKVDTLDHDPDLNPDFVGSGTAMPFDDASYDVVCAFQMLEHLPYEVSLKAFGEMVRVSRRHVVISLPDAKVVYRYLFHVPRLGSQEFFLPKVQLGLPEHEFDGEHYWEINKRGYPLSRVIADFSQYMRLIETYRVREIPYHRFFIFER